jgi:hypothetical protein
LTFEALRKANILTATSDNQIHVVKA